MREIKFRAWDGYTMVGFNLKDKTFITDQIVMQYTGLKDKNGKEIYEGDILKDKYGEIVKVSWDEERNGWNFNKPFVGWEEGCVIGNIYENPELIKN